MKMRRRRGIGALFLWRIRIPDDDIRALLSIFPEPFSRTDGREKSPPPSVPGRFAHGFPFICICARVCDNNMYSQSVAGDRAMTIIIIKKKKKIEILIERAGRNKQIIIWRPLTYRVSFFCHRGKPCCSRRSIGGRPCLAAIVIRGQGEVARQYCVSPLRRTVVADEYFTIHKPDSTACGSQPSFRHDPVWQRAIRVDKVSSYPPLIPHAYREPTCDFHARHVTCDTRRGTS